MRERWDPERVFMNRFLEDEIFHLPPHPSRSVPAVEFGRAAAADGATGEPPGRRAPATDSDGREPFQHGTRIV